MEGVEREEVRAGEIPSRLLQDVKAWVNGQRSATLEGVGEQREREMRNVPDDGFDALEFPSPDSLPSADPVHPHSPSPLPPPLLRPAIPTPPRRNLSSNERLELSPTAEAEEREEEEGWELESSGGEDKLGFELIGRS